MADDAKKKSIDDLLNKATAEKYGLGPLLEKIQSIEPFIEKVSTMQDIIKGDDGKTPVLGEDYLNEDEQRALLEAVTPKKGVDYDDGEPGDDGYSPVKGVDYMTEDDLAAIKKDATPVKGKDYFTDGEIQSFKQAITPVKGQDYNDGENPTPAQFLEVIKGLKGADAASFSQIVGSKIDISHVRNAGTFIFNGKQYKTEELMHGGGSSSGGGGVQTIAIATAHGLGGSSDGDATHPTLTLRTTVTGIVKGDGTNFTDATPNTDYQVPVLLTTTGTSGVATFDGTTLNIPQYQAAGTAVVSVTGTANRITSSGGTTPVIDIAATYVGQTSITTLGTIATGTWAGTTIAVNHGGTGGVTPGIQLFNNITGYTATGATGTTSTNLVFSTAPTLTNPVVGTQASSDNSTLAASTAYVTNAIATAVTGLLNYRGSYDASTNLFPATGGSGIAGAILKGDFWICSVAGTLGGTAVTPGDLIIALVNTPAQTAANWDLIAHDLGSYVTSITGTANQVIASASTGAVTLSLPQSIATSSSPQFATLELGNATDTTITRVSAGIIAVEGVTIATATNTLTFTNKTLTAPVINTPAITTATLNGVTTVAAGATLQMAVPTADPSATGPTTTSFMAGYTTAIGDLMYLDSSATWQKTDANAATTYKGLLSIALAVATSGNPVLVALKGSMVYCSTAFPTFTPGTTLYMSETAGAITDTQPTTTDAAIRVIGFAIHADKLYFDPSPDYITHT